MDQINRDPDGTVVRDDPRIVRVLLDYLNLFHMVALALPSPFQRDAILNECDRLAPFIAAIDQTPGKESSS